MLYRNKQNGNLYEIISDSENGIRQAIDLTDNQRCTIRTQDLENQNLFERVSQVEEMYALKLQDLKDFIKGAKDFYSIKD